MNDLYSDVLIKLGIYVESDVNEDNLGLILINEARQNLSRMKIWHNMLVHTDLTITDNIAVLPSDILDLRIYAIDQDTDDDLYPDQDSGFFYMGTNTTGYEFIPSGNKDTGYTTVLHFYDPPVSKIHCIYQRKLENFIGAGTEYTFFPGSLIVKYALWNHYSKEGLTNNDVSHLWNNFQKELESYIISVQNVNTKKEYLVNDSNGKRIGIQKFNLSTGR